jgi:hypothetical protein
MAIRELKEQAYPESAFPDAHASVTDLCRNAQVLQPKEASVIPPSFRRE